jgi:transposase-like protein
MARSWINSPAKEQRPQAGSHAGPLTAQQLAEAVALCLQEGLSCNGVAQRFGLPSSRLARWVRQSRIDRGQAPPRDQGLLSTEERSELNRLRQENRELRRENDFFRLAAAHFAKERCRRKVLPDRGADRAALGLLAVPAAGRGPQWFLRLTAAAGGAGKACGRERCDHRCVHR